MKTKDIKVGDCFGRLTVLSITMGVKHPRLLCRCECGTEKEFYASNVTKPDHTQSCGCYHKERTSEVSKTHGSTKTALYYTWYNIKNRCTKPEIACYHYYGGRGILLCPEWHNFANFQKWSLANGYTKDRQIDRIDNDGNYEPSNCRWVTQTENRRNRPDVLFYGAFGESKVLPEWAEDPRCIVSWRTLRARVQVLGWPIVEAMTLPIRSKRS